MDRPRGEGKERKASFAEEGEWENTVENGGWQKCWKILGKAILCI